MFKAARVRIPVTITRWAEVLVSFDPLVDDGSGAVDGVDEKQVLEQVCDYESDKMGAEIDWDNAEVSIEDDNGDD